MKRALCCRERIIEFICFKYINALAAVVYLFLVVGICISFYDLQYNKYSNVSTHILTQISTYTKCDLHLLLQQ